MIVVRDSSSSGYSYADLNAEAKKRGLLSAMIKIFY
jgi:hypothetical protein